MGFYYLLLLFAGVVLLIVGALKKIKKVFFPYVLGIAFIVISVLLLMPGSSDFISKLLIYLFY
ncbi:hypothetical protein G8761_09320 [Bacillus sp. C11]|nr:hypothetical protein [Neobacillus terrae]